MAQSSEDRGAPFHFLCAEKRRVLAPILPTNTRHFIFDLARIFAENGAISLKIMRENSPLFGAEK